MIKIYTDGACKGNPGVGGWGAIIMHNEKNISYLAVKMTQQTIEWN